MKRLLAIPILVLFAAACSDTAHLTQPEPVASPAPNFDRGGVPNDASGLDPSAAGAYEVNVTVTSSLVPSLPVGTQFPNCYTLLSDGTWIDPGFPAPGAAVPGTWAQDSRGTTSRYTAWAEAGGLRIEQTGKVTPWPGQDSRKLTAHSAVSAGETVLAEFLSRGYEVDSCAP